MYRRTHSLGFAALLLAGMAGCGGGGSDAGTPNPGTTASAEGLWIGSTATNRTITGLVLSDGTYYVLYSAAGNPSFIAGIVQGSGTSSGATFSSGNARDFNLEGAGVMPATVSASVVEKQSFNGSISYGSGGSTSFTSNYDATYEATPSLAAVAGTFTGQVALSAGVHNATVTVSAGGAIAGSGNGCAMTGTATPRTDGNAFNLTITFGAAPCFFANQSLNGVAYFDTSTKRLYAAAPDASRTDGVLFVGVKP